MTYSPYVLNRYTPHDAEILVGSALYQNIIGSYNSDPVFPFHARKVLFQVADAIYKIYMSARRQSFNPDSHSHIPVSTQVNNTGANHIDDFCVDVCWVKNDSDVAEQGDPALNLVFYDSEVEIIAGKYGYEGNRVYVKGCDYYEKISQSDICSEHKILSDRVVAFLNGILYTTESSESATSK